jgi:DNA-binding NtrC family response regulator
VRELENILERAVNLCEGSTILSKHLQIETKNEDNKDNKKNLKRLKDVVKEAEKEAIINALKSFNGNKKLAMEALDIGRTSFYDKLKKYNIKSS